MRSYNPRQWFGILFQIRKVDTLRELAPLIGVISGYTLVVAFLEITVFKLHQLPTFKNLNYMHQLVGLVLSVLLVFRTNAAYDRWWEGRKLWGALVNSSRNLSMKIASMCSPEPADLDFFRRTIPLYADTLRKHLQSEKTRFALDENDHPELAQLDDTKHAPNQVALAMFQRVATMQKEGRISGEQLLFIQPQLADFTDICGACERIKNTPIPYSYSAFIKKFIFIYTITLPFSFVGLLGYLVVPVVAFVFYVLASLELIAEEIEDPFGLDPNDLPLVKMAGNIETHTAEIFGV